MNIPVFHSQEEWKKAGRPNAWLFRKGWPDARTLDCWQLMYRACTKESDAKWHERTCSVATATVVEKQPTGDEPWSFDEQGKLLLEGKPVHVYFASGRWHGWFYNSQEEGKRDEKHFF